MTALTGWDRGTWTLIVTLEGIVEAHTARSSKDALRALPYLARALVGHLGARRQHPETVRDLLFSAHKALTQAGRRRLARRFHDTATLIADGSSWLYPYKAPVSHA